MEVDEPRGQDLAPGVDGGLVVARHQAGGPLRDDTPAVHPDRSGCGLASAAVDDQGAPDHESGWI